MNKTNLSFLYLIALLTAISISISLSSCRKEKIFEDSSAKVEFSKDTVVFDTVFVTLGSTYERFTVRNPYSNTLKLSQIRLGNGTSSAFRMNVDGVPGVLIKDIEIPPNDSVYVLVEVTVDPTNSLNPFVIEDYISFVVNGNEQRVQLAAWGQNAYFHYEADGFLIICNETWASDKPHVMYGVTAVDSSCELTINPGTEIYCYTNSRLYLYKSKLNVNGVHGNEVVFQGIRKEAAFANEPGQWYGIHFFEARESSITHSIIKNSTVGIQADTLFQNDTIVLNSTESFNNSFSSLLGQGARIKAINCKFNKAGTHAVALRFGGDYYLNHCTINNFWTASTRSSPALVVNDYFVVNSTAYFRPINANINNSIIYGDIDNELVIDTISGGSSIYTFNHCLIKTDQPTSSPNFINIKKNLNPRYISGSSYILSSTSPAIDQADSSPSFYLSTDIETSPRPFGSTDIGCFEY